MERQRRRSSTVRWYWPSQEPQRQEMNRKGAGQENLKSIKIEFLNFPFKLTLLIKS